MARREWLILDSNGEERRCANRMQAFSTASDWVRAELLGMAYKRILRAKGYAVSIASRGPDGQLKTHHTITVRLDRETF